MPTDPADATAAYRAADAAVDEAKAQAKALVRASQDRLRAARADLKESVVAAYRNGARVGDLADITGMTREWVRQTLRAAGIHAPDFPDWHGR